VKEQLRSFLEFLRLNRNVSPHTTAAYDSDLSQFLVFAAALRRTKTSDLRPADLDLATVRAFMADLYRQGQARSSVSRKLSALRTFTRYLRREGLIEGDPVALLCTTIAGRRSPGRFTPRRRRRLDDPVAKAAPHHPLDGQEVGEGGERAIPHPELRATEPARAVMDGDLHDSISGERDQGGHEPVHARVGRDRGQALAAHDAQAARAVLQAIARHGLADPVGRPRRQALEPRVVPDLPPADHGVGGVEPGEERGEVAGIALQIAVHGGHQAAPRGLESRVERGAQPRVALQPDRANARIGLGEPADDVPAAIRGAVVDDDHLGRSGEAGQHLGQLGPEDGQVLDLVVHGQDHRQRDVMLGNGPDPSWFDDVRA